MSRTALKYVYLSIGWPLAMIFDIASTETARDQADVDDDGEAERSVAQEKMQRERHLRNNESRARPPKEAAEYRAQEIFTKPLRTVGLLVGYEVVFLSVAVAITFTDLVKNVGGETVGTVADVVSTVISPYIPTILIPLLPMIAAIAGAIFALIVHQSFKTSTDIRSHGAL
jgi:hypothetical protein